MSKNDPIDLRQDRRQWLKTSASVLGASLLPMPAIAEQTPEKTPAAPEAKSEAATAAAKSLAHFFTLAQHHLVDELSETIIPKDGHSGGAKDAKCADFIEQVIREHNDPIQQALWRDGLRLIDSMSQHYNGKSFVDASPEDRITVITVLSDNEHMTDLVEVRFYRELKHLTVQGYYTSKIGIHDDLEYKGNRILMDFVGCDDPTPKT